MEKNNASKNSKTHEKRDIGTNVSVSTISENSLKSNRICTSKTAIRAQFDEPHCSTKPDIVVLENISRHTKKIPDTKSFEIVTENEKFIKSVFSDENCDLSEFKLFHNEEKISRNLVAKVEFLLKCSRKQFIKTVSSNDAKNERKVMIPANSEAQVQTSPICRICYGNDGFEPLVEACNCRGSVGFVHRSCLEYWLRESSRNYCELCQYQYKIIRIPKYNFLKSLFVWLVYPGEYRSEFLYDVFGFCIYTPTALLATYILLVSCDNMCQVLFEKRSLVANLIACVAITVHSLGMASIDFAYSSWLIMRIQKFSRSWRQWNNNNCQLTLLLSKTNIFEKRYRSLSTETILT